MALESDRAEMLTQLKGKAGGWNGVKSAWGGEMQKEKAVQGALVQRRGGFARDMDEAVEMCREEDGGGWELG